MQILQNNINKQSLKVQKFTVRSLNYRILLCVLMSIIIDKKPIIKTMMAIIDHFFFWLMKTRSTRLFLELNVSAFLARCFSFT